MLRWLKIALSVIVVAGCTTSKTMLLPAYTLDNGQRLQDVVTVASDPSGSTPAITVVKTYDVSQYGQTAVISHDSASAPGVGTVVAGAVAGAIPHAVASAGAAAIVASARDRGTRVTTNINSENTNQSTNQNTNQNVNTNENIVGGEEPLVCQPGFVPICDPFRGCTCVCVDERICPPAPVDFR